MEKSHLLTSQKYKLDAKTCHTIVRIYLPLSQDKSLLKAATDARRAARHFRLSAHILFHGTRLKITVQKT